MAWPFATKQNRERCKVARQPEWLAAALELFGEKSYGAAHADKTNSDATNAMFGRPGRQRGERLYVDGLLDANLYRTGSSRRAVLEPR